MKLSYVEKIVLMVVVAVITLIVGFVIAIKPQLSVINDSSANLVQKLAERDEIDNKIQTANAINEKLKAIYDEDKTISEFFFPEMDTYQVDQYISKILKAHGLNIESLALTPMEASDVEFYVPTTEVDTSYPLQASADLSVATVPAETDANGAAVTSAPAEATPPEAGKAGLSTVTIAYNTSGKENVKAFLDEIDELDKSIIVTNCTITSGDTGVTGSITIKIYSIKEISELTFITEK